MSGLVIVLAMLVARQLEMHFRRGLQVDRSDDALEDVGHHHRARRRDLHGIAVQPQQAASG